MCRNNQSEVLVRVLFMCLDWIDTVLDVVLRSGPPFAKFVYSANHFDLCPFEDFICRQIV